MGYGVWGIGFRAWGARYGVEGTGYGVWGIGFRVWGARYGVEKRFYYKNFCRGMGYV